MCVCVCVASSRFLGCGLSVGVVATELELGSDCILYLRTIKVVRNLEQLLQLRLVVGLGFEISMSVMTKLFAPNPE